MSQVENSILPTPLDGWSQIQGVQIATELAFLGREVSCKTCSASVCIFLFRMHRLPYASLTTRIIKWHIMMMMQNTNTDYAMACEGLKHECIMLLFFFFLLCDATISWKMLHTLQLSLQITMIRKLITMVNSTGQWHTSPSSVEMAMAYDLKKKKSEPPIFFAKSDEEKLMKTRETM